VGQVISAVAATIWIFMRAASVNADAFVELHQLPFNSRALALAHCAHGANLYQQPEQANDQSQDIFDWLVRCLRHRHATAEPAGPPAGYEIDPECTEKFADGAITIEQYVNKETDDWKWQFWVRRKDTFTLLAPGFRFTNDLKWIVRRSLG
jgi:hypothetical protein